jgi:excisionase family DNA binding protein
MSSEFIDVPGAARELGVVQSRVRSLIASGALPAEKLGSRWLLDRRDVAARLRQPTAPGRPLRPRNAWILLLAASGEEPDAPIDPLARWRMRRALAYPGLAAMRSRADRRACTHRFWTLPGELRALHDEPGLVLSGSSAAGKLGLDLLAPDTLDVYLPASQQKRLVRRHGLQMTSEAEANILLRAVPDEDWLLANRRIAPIAAVALDLASYPDSRSSRVGLRLLDRLAAEHAQP